MLSMLFMLFSLKDIIQSYYWFDKFIHFFWLSYTTFLTFETLNVKVPESLNSYPVLLFPGGA